MGIQSEVDVDLLIQKEEELQQQILESQQNLQLKIQSYGKNMWLNGLTVGFLGGAMTTILLIMIGKNRK
jgi:hypothetical protein